MSSFKRDTLLEYRCGLGSIPASKLQQTFSSLISCLDSGATFVTRYPARVHIAITSGGSSE
ncbi:MAG: hypothetical protein RBS43_03745 [Candidatus Cloacimonas sp.]|jgi:hypothetical protein|nr:hypothetical protein [Candidatus Cloacimonas sp.]